jgi:hypothetical protein
LGLGEGIHLENKTLDSNEVLIEILDTYIPTLIEPNPIQFQKRHKNISHSLKRHFNIKSKKILKLRKSMIRNQFLYNCLEFTNFEQIEYLILGYGTKRGVGTDIKQMQIILGDSNSVGISQTVENKIERWMLDIKNEIVVFHNHPRYWVNALFKDPLPSGTDRDTMFNYKLTANYIFRIFLQKGGGVKFYLGDNGKVREFKNPRLKRVIQALEAAGIINNPL